MEIIVGGGWAALMFTLFLWRTKASITAAFYWLCGLGAFVLVMFWAMPVIEEALRGVGIFQDLIRGQNPKLVVGFIFQAIFVVVLLLAKPEED